MSRVLNKTEIALNEALERILKKEPRNICPDRRLSVRAVEAEAGLSRNSAYHYAEFRQKVDDHVLALYKIPGAKELKEKPYGQRLELLKSEKKALKAKLQSVEAELERKDNELFETFSKVNLLEQKLIEMTRQLNKQN